MLKKVSFFIALAILLSACATLSGSPATQKFECGWPGFTVTYPADWVVLRFRPEMGQVFRAGKEKDESPDVVVSVSAHQGRPLKYYSRALLPVLSSMGSEFKIVKDQAVALEDGTQAWETRLNWMLNSGKALSSLFLTTEKEDMWITTAVTNQQGEMPEELEAIAYSLKVSSEKEELVEVPADIRKFFDNYSAAIVNHALDDVMVNFSDDYLDYGRKKSDVESFFKGVIELIPSHKIFTTSFQSSGDTAQVAGYAVIAGGKFAIPGFHLKKNEAGRWQIYGNQKM